MLIIVHKSYQHLSLSWNENISMCTRIRKYNLAWYISSSSHSSTLSIFIYRSVCIDTAKLSKSLLINEQPSGTVWVYLSRMCTICIDPPRLFIIIKIVNHSKLAQVIKGPSPAVGIGILPCRCHLIFHCKTSSSGVYT